MKRNLLCLLTLLMVVGWSNAWAETVNWISFNGKNNINGTEYETTAVQTSLFFKWNNSKHNFNTKFNGATYEGILFIQGLKMEGGTSVSFTTSQTSTVVIVQSRYGKKTINWDGAELDSTKATLGTGYREYTIANVSAGEHAVTRGDGESGIFYIKVTEAKPAPTLGFNYGNEVTAVIPADQSSTTVVNALTTNPESAAVTWSIVNAGTTGATVLNASGHEGEVTVTGAGTCVVRASTAETTSYSASYADYTMTVIQGQWSGPDTYTQSYPYTWDFTASSSVWTTTQTQLITTYSDWTGGGTYYHQSHNYGSYPIGYNIDAIRGLRFSNNYLGLDWSYGHIWFAGGSIVIPGLSEGQTVTFVMEGRDESANTTLTAANTSGSTYTITKSNGSHATYTYTVTTSGDITFTFDHAVSIRSIAIGSSSFTIDVSKLMIIANVNANRNINRTIPCATLTFGGGDGIKFNATDKFILRDSGTFTVALRKGDATAKMLGMVLHGDFSKYTKSSITDNITVSSGTIVKTNNNTLTWTSAAGGADEVTFTNVDVSGVSVTISSMDVTTNGKTLDATKVTPSFGFSPSSASASAGASGTYTTTLTSTPGFFRDAVTFNAGVTGTVKKSESYTYGTTSTVYTLTSGTTAGTATLTAQSSASDYFNASSATTYTLTIASGKVEVTNFAFNKDEALYTGTGGSTYVNSKVLTNAGTSEDPFKFVYDASKTTLKTKFFLDPSLATMGAEANSTYFGVTSADATILDVSNATFSSAENGTRIYVDGIRVLKAGTTSLTITFKGSTNYNSKSVTVYFNVVEPITTYSGTYPFTWDFTGSTSWESSRIQAAYHNSHWTTDGNAAKLTSETYVPHWNDIDKIVGMEFHPTDGNKEYFWLNWNDNKVFINGTMTIYNLSPDYVVRISAPTGQTIKVGETTLTEESSGVYVFTPTTVDIGENGAVTFTLNTDVYSVAVTRGAYTATYTAITSTDLHEGVAGTGDDARKFLIDGKERNLKGKWEFIGAGTITAGTVIDAVPGITMTIGKSGSSYAWEVKTSNGRISVTAPNSITPAVTGRTAENNWIPTDGYYIVFEPVVNGFIELSGHFFGGSTGGTVGELKAEDGTIIHSFSGTTDGDVVTQNPLIAGEKYYLYSLAYPLELHGFTFRPAFIGVNTSTGELDNTDISTTYKYADSQTYYSANLTIPADRFPKLIMPGEGGGEGKVKFSGERTIVNLKGNNDVELIGSGNTIIKGTVLLDGSDEELFTYYYLQSTILQLPSTTFNGTAIADQDYVDDNTSSSDTYTFTFSDDIAKVSDAVYKVYMRTDAGDEVDITSLTSISGKTLTATFPDDGDNKLVDGSTYRIRIAAGSIKASKNDDVTNAEIVRTFSIINAGEKDIPIKMIYPTGVATIGTSIVLETYDLKTAPSTYNDLIDNNSSYKGSGRLKKDGTAKVIEVGFVISGRRLIAKPKETLENNTAYTLILDANCLITKDNGAILRKAKAFSFVTGASAGTEVVVVSTYPVNDPAGNTPMPVAYYSGGRISVTFDQAIELEPYSTAYATPVNGNESQTATTALSGEAATLKVDSDNKTVCWDFNNSDYLKYDLFYEIRIPANTVVASGGKPNTEDITFRFRMPMNPNATPVEANEFYPHTWDFNRFGSTTDANSSISIIKANTNTEIDNRNNADHPNYDAKNAFVYSSIDGGKDYLCNAKSNFGFDQGNDIYIATSTTTTHMLPEFQGIRVSTKNAGQSKRFAIRDLGTTNADGTGKYVFRMNGNTHYMTLSNVPAGKLYMLASSVHLGINTPNAEFESVSGSDYTLSNENTLLEGNNADRKIVINVKEAGDVSFCVANFNCHKIAVAVDTKRALSSYSNYFTDCQEHEMRYDLTGDFTDTGLTAYYINNDNIGQDGSAYQTGGSSITLTPLTYNVAMAGEGTIIVANKSNSSIPIFKTDVNTKATTHTTALVGVLEDTYVEAKDDTYRNYAFTKLAGRVDPETGVPVEEFTTCPLGFYRAMAGTLGAHKCYLHLPLAVADAPQGAKTMLFLNFEEPEVTGVQDVNAVNRSVQQQEVYYTLTGVRLNKKPTTRGIYIMNGKKVYIK